MRRLQAGRLPIDQIAQTDYCERYLSGTSMAAPHVTGTVGLMKSRNRNLLPAQITDILVRTAQTGTACPPVTCGAGLLDAGLAVRYAPLGGVPAASSPRLDLGNVAIGASATASASLTNTGRATMTPGAMSITGGNGQVEFAFPSGPCTSGTVCSQPIAPLGVNQLAAIPLRCKPTPLGSPRKVRGRTGRGDVRRRSQRWRATACVRMYVIRGPWSTTSSKRRCSNHEHDDAS